MAISRWMYKGQKVGSNVNFINDTATITSSSEAAGGNNNDDNVVDDLVGKTWRTTANTAQWIKKDLGSDKLVTMVAIVKHNLSPTATFKIQAHATDLGAGDWAASSPTLNATFTYVNKYAGAGTNFNANPIYTSDLHRIRGTAWDSGGQISTEYGKAIWMGSVTKRWWNFYFDDGSNDQAFIEVGRMAMGEWEALSRNYAKSPDGAFNAEQFDSSQEVPLHNRAQMGFVKRAKYWRINMQLLAMPLADKVWMQNMFDAIGITEPVVFMPRPTTTTEANHDNTMIIYSKILGSFIHKDKVSHLWALDLSLKEAV